MLGRTFIWVKIMFHRDHFMHLRTLVWSDQLLLIHLPKNYHMSWVFTVMQPNKTISLYYKASSSSVDWGVGSWALSLSSLDWGAGGVRELMCSWCAGQIFFVVVVVCRILSRIEDSWWTFTTTQSLHLEGTQGVELRSKQDWSYR